MPSPKPDESHDDFIERCIPVVLDDGTAKSSEQAVAVCESLFESRSMTSRRRLISASLDPSAVRTAEWLGDNHLVVPVVLMVGDSVVTAMNAPGPELVPADELRASADCWNGRPILPKHPDSSNGSANDPVTLESLSFGQIFGSVFEDNKLKSEAWINLRRAEELGGDPQRVAERLQEGEMVEVSVGAWAKVQRSAGIQDGYRYGGIWRDISSDHLAMLPEGSIGACSNDMGCGAPRLNQGGDMPNSTMEVVAKIPGLNLLSRLLASKAAKDDLSLLESAKILIKTAQEGLSASDMGSKLWQALDAIEPSFDWIEDFWPDDGIVVYATSPNREFHMWRRGFSVGEDGEISLDEEREEVESVRTYQVVAAEGSEIRSTCSCSNNSKKTGAAAGAPENDTGSDPEGEDTVSNDNTKELVGRLIPLEGSPFNDDHRETLEALDEDTLKAMIEKCQPDQADPDPKGRSAEGDGGEDDPDPSAAQPRRLGEDEFLAQAPESVRQMIARHKKQDEDHRKNLISKIKSAQSVEAFSESQLKEMSTEDLISLSRALGADSDPSYEGVFVPSVDESSSPPDPYEPALERLRASQAAK